MKKISFILTLFLAVSFLPRAVFADSGNTGISLEEVIVADEILPAEEDESPVQNKIIDQKQIQESSETTLGGILKEQAGTMVNDYGTEGCVKTISLRGAPSSQVLVLVDGRRFSDIQGTTDLSLIPLSAIESIEIQKGGLSSIYGASAMGGVVKIILKKSARKTFRFTFENSSYLPEGYTDTSGTPVAAESLALLDGQKAALDVSLKFPGIEVLTTGSFTSAENGFFYTDGSGTRRKRENAGCVEGSLHSSVYIPLADGFMNFQGSGFVGEVGAPGSLTLPSAAAKQNDLKADGSFEFNSDRFLADSLSLNVRGSYAYSENGYTDPDWAINSKHISHQANFSADQENLVADFLSLAYGAGLSYDYLTSTDLGEHDRFSTFVYLTAEWNILKDTVLKPSFRYDYSGEYPFVFNYSLGLTQGMGKNLYLKALAGRSYNVPNLNDLYWPNAFGMSGNPDLLPETAYTLDIGTEYDDGVFMLSAFGFTRYVQDTVLWLEQPVGFWSPHNCGEGLYAGADASVSVKLWDIFTVGADYTYTYSTILSGTYTSSDDKRMPYCPAHAVKARAGIRTEKDDALLSFVYQDSMFLDRDNNSIRDGFFNMDFSYIRKLSDHVSLSAVCKNLLNAEYMSVKGYPSPGLSIKLGAVVEF
ncbi:MAG: TonB-dependent receptor [Spirochaetales bacterium]|nr:TonB-dependent receptor [Spirochaetales bacterium]